MLGFGLGTTNHAIQLMCFRSVIKMGSVAISTYLANIPSIRTLNLPDELESQLLIDAHIGISLRALKVARHSLLVGLLRHTFHELLSHAHATSLGVHPDNIAKVISSRILPDRIMGGLLHLLPDPVSAHIQTPTTKEENIVHKLAEREKPFLSPDRPSLWH
jgi:hypothetical protein